MAAVGKMSRPALDASVQFYGRLSKMYYETLPYDILGKAYMDIAAQSKSKAMGQYFTPDDVCEMMAQMTLGDIPEAIAKAKAEGRRLSIHDPCVGSGAMLLAAKRVIMRESGYAGLDYFEFYGQDIDPLCVRMAKIQMTLSDFRYMGNLMVATAGEMKGDAERSRT